MLAWSTVSQVSIMLAAIAVAGPGTGPDAGLLHLWSHAIYKSLLFLAIGWAAVVAGGTAATTLPGERFGYPGAAGRVPRRLPLARRGAARRGRGVEGARPVLRLGRRRRGRQPRRARPRRARGPLGRLTAAYAARGYLVLTAHVRQRPSAGPVPLGVPGLLWVLVVLTVFGGLVVLTRSFAVHGVCTLAAAHRARRRCRRRGRLRRFFDRDPAGVLARRFMPLADRGLEVDALYRRLVAAVLRLARVVAFVDTEVVDAYVRGAAVATRAAGWAGVRAHRRERPSAGVGLVLGAVVVLGLVGVLAWS